MINHAKKYTCLSSLVDHYPSIIKPVEVINCPFLSMHVLLLNIICTILLTAYLPCLCLQAHFGGFFFFRENAHEIL